MANILKKLFWDGLQKKAVDHPELYAHYRSFPRFKLPTEDKLSILNEDFLIRDLSLGGISIWAESAQGQKFVGKEENDLKGKVKFFDGTLVDLELNIARFDRNILAFEFTNETKARVRAELSRLLAPIELGKTIKFVSNNDRKLTSEGPTYWYRGRNNTDLFIWVEKDKVKRWQLTFRGVFVENLNGSFTTGKYDEYKRFKEVNLSGNPLVLLDANPSLDDVREAYLILKSIEDDEQGLVEILIKQIREVN